MYVTVAGPRGGVVREEETLFSFASRCADILNIIDRDIDLEIIVSDSLEKEYADAIGLCWGEPNDISIQLARKCSGGEKQDILKTLAHEMIHARQLATGQRLLERPVLRNESFLHEIVMESI